MLLHLAAAREAGRRGMLIAEINGDAATAHPAARLFIEQGFAATAMGLQARVSGTTVAGLRRGGSPMADPRNDEALEQESEQERVRNSNDQDQELEREGIESEHNKGYDDAVRGQAGGDVDPDSADADVDRDDTVAD
jgi:hypothetical protein